MKTVLLALSLAAAALPAIAQPASCHHDMQQTATMTCAEGLVWDEKAAACVAITG